MEKKKLLKNRFNLIIVTMSIISMYVFGLIIGLNTKRDSNINQIGINPELARAMTYDKFEDGDENIDGTDNVKFSAFFLRDLDGDGYTEKIKGTCKEIGSQDTLYMEVNVLTEGALKNGKITIDGKNFYLKAVLPKDTEFKENVISENAKEIKFNTIVNGTQKMFYTTLRSGDYTYSSGNNSAIGTTNTNNYSRNDNKIIFTGTYEVADELGTGTEEIQIRKEIPLTVDWYGKTSTYIHQTNIAYENLDDCIDRENGFLNLSFTVGTSESAGKLMIAKNHLEGTIPELNGFSPIEVSSKDKNFTYDENTRKFVVERNSTVNDNGIITSSVSRSNTYTINVKYPIEAYDIQESEKVRLTVPVEEYYDGYNNKNEDFSNPYRSNIAKANLNIEFRKFVPRTYSPSLSVIVGKYVSNPYSTYIVSKQKPLRIYNEVSSEERDDTYQVYWSLYTGTNPNGDKIVLRESNVEPEVSEVSEENQQVDKFVKNDNSLDSMNSLTTNKAISFSGINKIIKENGIVKVYDETTGVLLTEINKNNYNDGDVIYFENPIDHIRVEIEGYKSEASLGIYMTKELDDAKITDEETGYSREEFDNLKFIRSYLVGFMGETKIGSTSYSARYVEPCSIATISISKPTISTQVTENEIITIDAQYNILNNLIGWTNGDFLVKLPNEIINVELNDVRVDNDSITITNREYIENESGKFIRINTINQDPIGFKIYIDANITADPRIDSVKRDVILYASNAEGTYYYYQANDKYDVNNNMSVVDQVNKTQTQLSFISPNSLLTNSTVSEFDDSGKVIVSPNMADIRPAYVSVDNDELSAKIGVQVKNNYASKVSDMVILGKIPFEGNTYAVTGRNMGSNFTTKMKNTGIQIPSELNGLIDVYYSTNPSPSKELVDDLGNSNTDWKLAEDVEDWDQIKTFLIDFKDMEILPGAQYIFYYEISIPNGLDFNSVSYSHHGIYFSLNTEEGKYRTKTEPNKVGLRIAEKYNLELNKFQSGKEKNVAGSTYVVTEIFNIDGEEKTGKSKSAITDEDGKIRIDDLYAEILYEVKEIKTTDDYELNEDIVRFICHVDKETGELIVEKLTGDTRDEIQVTKNENNKYLTSINVEDEAKARLKVVKVNKETDEPIRGVKYKISGYGLPENGKNVTTNYLGEISIVGLYVGREYTLEEIKAEGYYLNETVSFKIVNQNGEYQILIKKDNEYTLLENNKDEEIGICNAEVLEEKYIPIVSLKISDEKIPRYNLQIKKIAAGTDNVLQGAKFRLYKNNKQLRTYETDENGLITIDDLYLYEDSRGIDQTYRLEEIISPEGYVKTEDIIFSAKSIEVTEEGNTTTKLVLNQNVEKKYEKPYLVEGNTIFLNVEDQPTFKMIKRDAETNEVLPNTKFAIYDVSDNEVIPARNSKKELIGEKEVINGEEYYVITTNESGELTCDLPEGIYKVVEVEAADEKYDIIKNVEYVGIGRSRPGEIVPEYVKAFGGNIGDDVKYVFKTSDGGCIVAGNYASPQMVLDPTHTLTNKSSGTAWGGDPNADVFLIKYSSDGNVEWAKDIGRNDNQYLGDFAITEDDGYLLALYAFSLDLGNGISITGQGMYDSVIIKLASDGSPVFIDHVPGSGSEEGEAVGQASDGGYYLAGFWDQGTINFGSGMSFYRSGTNADAYIVKYDKNKRVKWAKALGDSSSHTNYMDLAPSNDGGVFAAGHFTTTNLNVGNNKTLRCKRRC